MHGVSKYIAAVRAHAETSAETAYVDRIKIQRSVLKLHRAVAAELGEHRPDTLEARLRDHGGMGSTSNRVATIAALMCQPSEALDRRWMTHWEALQTALRELERNVGRAVAMPE